MGNVLDPLFAALKVYVGGVGPRPMRGKLNCLNGITVTDNSANDSHDVSVPGPTPLEVFNVAAEPAVDPPSGAYVWGFGHAVKARSKNSVKTTLVPAGEVASVGVVLDRKVTKIATVDATVTTALSHTVPLASVLDVEATVVGYRTGGAAAGAVGDSCRFVRRAAYKRVAGGAALVGTVDTIGADKKDDAAVGAPTLDTDGANALRVRVTGVAAMNLTWAVEVRIVQVTP